jgi:hypothetical protein
MITITNKTITSDQPSIVYVFGKGIARRYPLDKSPYSVAVDVPDGLYKIVQENLKGVKIGETLNDVMLSGDKPKTVTKGLNILSNGLMKWPLSKLIKTDAGDETLSAWLNRGSFKEFRFWYSSNFKKLASVPQSLISKIGEYLNTIPGSVANICMATESWSGVSQPTMADNIAAAKQLIDAIKSAGLPIDRIKIELGNEPERNGGRYFPWSFAVLAQMVNVMARLFTEAGFYVIGPACTGDADGSKTKDLYKLLDPRYFRAIGMHLYRQSAGGVRLILDNLKDFLPDKDWAFTEARVYWGGNYLTSIDPQKTIRNSKGEDKHKDPPKTADEVNAEDEAEFVAVKSYADRRNITYTVFNDIQQFETMTGPIGLVDREKDDTLILTVFGEKWTTLN